MFTVERTLGQARAGTLRTGHGEIATPFFMPIATKGAVKFLSADDFFGIGNQIILANAYHLFLRPGLDVLRQFGGLHALMRWSGPLLTDSGGFQVFSLADRRHITNHGVVFNSHIDGRKIEFTPELSMEIQSAIGADIWMCFDYFPGYPAASGEVERSVQLTTQWARQCRQWFTEAKSAGRVPLDTALFGIVQGGTDLAMRKRSAQELQTIGFEGYAMGGLAVGEPSEVMYEVLDATVPELPVNQARYVMGVGQPEQILAAVKRGIDMFDCVLPTRNARHGQVYIQTAAELVTPDLAQVNYTRTIIKRSEYRVQDESLDPYCDCATCGQRYSRAYIRHLFTVDEPVAKRLVTIHNLRFYIRLMEVIRRAIHRG